MELACWNCGGSLAELPRPITRHMNCPRCFEDLHCCRMCRHYLHNATDPCAEERAEPPVYKEGANFCEYFRPSEGRYEAGRGERQARAQANLDALFGGEADAPAEDPQAGQARAKLDELFR